MNKQFIFVHTPYVVKMSCCHSFSLRPLDLVQLDPPGPYEKISEKSIFHSFCAHS